MLALLIMGDVNMAKKKKNNLRPKVKLIGNNATDVTQSIALIEFKNKKYLIEAGQYQGDTVLNEYRINKSAFDNINVEEIDYCFVSHAHIDHTGLLPLLVKKGFKGQIITTEVTSKLLRPLLEDGSFIHSRNSMALSKKHNTKFEAIYDELDVNNTMKLIKYYDYDLIHKLDDNVSFKFLHNSHILGAASIEIYLRDDESNKTYKIFYSGDLGNDLIYKPFVDKTEYCINANLAIFESTYGANAISMTKKDRKEEVKKIKNMIKETVVDKKGILFFPSFSMDRSQSFLKLIYDICTQNEELNNVEVLVDSRLTKKITEVYQSVLKDEDKMILDELLEWKNVTFISDYYKETVPFMNENKPKIVISSSGFLSGGHSVEWCKNLISKSNNTICFIGYASPQSIAGKLHENISNPKQTITINGQRYRIKCRLEKLNTFSSHIQQESLVNYIKSINCDRVVLLHGSSLAKEELQKVSREELNKCNKTTRITIAKKNMVIEV